MKLPHRVLTRLAFVQYTYNTSFEATKTFANGLVDYEKTIAVDKILMDELTQSLMSNQSIMHNIINNVIGIDGVTRLSLITKAILQSATCELLISSLHKAIIISEYVKVADYFLPTKEKHFINAMLQKITDTITKEGINIK